MTRVLTITAVAAAAVLAELALVYFLLIVVGIDPHRMLDIEP